MTPNALFTVVASIGLTALANVASAAILNAGSEIPAVSTPFNPLLGTFVASTGPIPLAAITFSGTLTEEVRQESLAANPLGGLTFVYQVINSGGSASDIERQTTFNFGGFAVDATYYQLTAGDQTPIFFNRSGTGSVIGQDFGLSALALNPGETSALMVLRTAAPNYVPGLNAVIDSSSVTVQGYSPIPEPTTLLTALGLGSLLLLRPARRRSSKT